MSEYNDPDSPIFSITALITSVIAVGALTFCTPQPAHALALEQCAVHATFAHALRDPSVSPEQLEAWVLEQDPEEHVYFQALGNIAAENIDAVRAMSPQQFAEAVFSMCEKAVQGETI